MTTYRQGDIILVPFLFSEGAGTKKRPALVISSDQYNENRQEVVILAVTSNIERILPGDTVIDKWNEAGLLYPSLVAGIVQTIKRKMIIRKLGSLSKPDFQKVQHNLKQAIGL